MQGIPKYDDPGLIAYSSAASSTASPPPLDFTTIKGVYKNCRGIWAAQWTDEKGQRHTKYFNPKFFANEATAKLEAYKFKVAIQREIEAKGGVQRKRHHNGSQLPRPKHGRGTAGEFFNHGRRIRRSGAPYCAPTGDYAQLCSGASPELIAMLQSINSSFGMEYAAYVQPPPPPRGYDFFVYPTHDSKWAPDSFRTGDCVDGAHLSERMLEGFEQASEAWWCEIHPYQMPSYTLCLSQRTTGPPEFGMPYGGVWGEGAAFGSQPVTPAEEKLALRRPPDSAPLIKVPDG